MKIVCSLTFLLIGDLSFSTRGIENVLNNLSTSTSTGPDCIPHFILKLCSSIIVPVLQVIFTQSLNDQTLPIDWLALYQFTRKVTETWHRPDSLRSTCCKVIEHIVFQTVSITSFININTVSGLLTLVKVSYYY